MVFKTRIYHCNVDFCGNLYLEILKDAWSPALTISDLLHSIRSIFLNPDPRKFLCCLAQFALFFIFFLNSLIMMDKVN